MPLRVIKTILIIITLVLMAPLAHASHGEYTKYEMSAALLPEKGEFRGGVRIYLPTEEAKKPVHTIYTGSVQIMSVKLNDKEISVEVRDGAMKVKGQGVLDILFAASVGDGASADGPDNSGVVRGNAITNTAAFLQTGWYPRLAGPGMYSLSVFVPEGLVAVSEADVAGYEEINGGRRYDFDLFSPTDNITLVVDSYEVLKMKAGDVSVEAYFYRQDLELGKKYLERTAEYIRMYEEILGPFPYKRFAVVEGALPTGYSMPTFTLIGQSVLRLPFILETSLGHEVLHQWYGNSVRIAEGGNWSEGLTSYMADYLYDEMKGEGKEHRKRLLMDFRNYVSPATEISLGEFRSRTDLATRAVGYAKGAMVFHMLRKELGDDTFNAGLRRIYRDNKDGEAGWDDIRKAFESASGRDLKVFFDGWINHRGVLNFYFNTAYPLVLGGKDMVYLEISQRGEAENFLLPVKVVTEAGVTEHTVRVERQRQGFELEAGGRPLAVVLDSGYDLMRRLDFSEAPPVISMLTGPGGGIVVVPDDGAEKYAPVAEAFRSRGYSIVNASQLRFSDMTSRPSVIMSGAEDLLTGLFGHVPESPVREAGLVLDVIRNPLAPQWPLALVYVTGVEEAEAAAHKLTRYGNYSRIAFSQGDKVLSEIAPSEEGIRRDVGLRAGGIRVKDTLGLDDIVREASKKPVIFVGEAHTSYEHHKVQLEFIRRLHESGQKVAIGMEMFQTPFQNALDGYVEGDLDEKEFLKRSEYFTRWSYNWKLYREILDYARANSIPVVALNQRSEIIRKVSGGGLDALSADERAQLPADMDLVSPEYMDRLRAVFNMHSQGRDFGNFYTSQVIWDETMAHSIADFIKDNPGRKMVVITGQGHTAWRSGIPERVRRIAGLEYSLVIQSEGVTLDPRQADFLMFTEPMAAPDFPVIGVKVRSVSEGLSLDEVQDGGPASLAGLRAGDIITMAGGMALKDITDLKLALMDVRPGDTVELKVLRKRFLRGLREEAFTVRY